MIAYIRGTLTEKDPTRVVIEAAGVGYELVISLSTYEALPREGAEAKRKLAENKEKVAQLEKLAKLFA